MNNKIKEWWNSVKDNINWSGAIVGLEWDDLWEEAKEELTVIYNAINK